LFEPIRYRGCGNHCIFCFVDQNPKGLRQTLYFKDEDYRLSFLYGNYVTLTRASEADLRRIAEQRLSPLYLSIHALDVEIRKRMLGIQKEDHLLSKIRYLAENRIEMHGQIVLCPGLNDGSVLEQTLTGLESFYPALKSLAIVPVGLTRYRDDLPLLQPVDAKQAKNVIRQIEIFQKKYLQQWGDCFVYPADEFYLLADRAVPDSASYGDMWQIENGVGMIRSLLDSVSLSLEHYTGDMEPKLYTAITGTLAGPVLNEHIVPRIYEKTGLEIQILTVANRFYGESVTVSGLLTGQDILAALEKQAGSGPVLLPGNCLNTDGIFLDDMTPQMLTDRSHRKVMILDHFTELWEN